MALFRYEDYQFDSTVYRAEFALQMVLPIWTGDSITGFLKMTNCQEIADLHEQGVISYAPDQQRGYSLRYENGNVVSKAYQITPRKYKEIARNIAENKAHNRFRTINCRYGHVELYFEEYPAQTIKPGLGTLHLRRCSVDENREISGFFTVPDSAHRQAGDCWFANEIASSHFSPEHAGFTPDTYDLILHITLADKDGEGMAHYEHNELVSPSSPTRRVFLEGGQTVPANWVAHELLTLNSETRELTEVYARNISKNSSKIITLATLVRGIEMGWHPWITEASKRDIALSLDKALRLIRSEVPEWSLLPFTRRQQERDNFLYSQAIFQIAMIRILGDWYGKSVVANCPHDWEVWRPQFRALKRKVYSYNGWQGEFLSRDNPAFWSNPGGSIYQLKKEATVRKNAAERDSQPFVLNPRKDLSVQNTAASVELAYQFLSSFMQNS